MIYYMSPGTPETLSGGTRKLYDHVAILQENGFDAMIIPTGYDRSGFHGGDLVVVPEVYGQEILKFKPGVPRVGFCQNGYLVDRWGIPDKANHPYETCQDVIGVMVDSEHTAEIIRTRYPKTKEIILTHSSGNGRTGKLGPFWFAPWPRPKRIVYFQYKHEHLNPQIFNELPLPQGWWIECMTGKSDCEIAELYRQSSIFVAANFEEGLCAPTQEAMISGTYIVGWYGGGTEEYLKGRSTMVEQDNIALLREAIVHTAWAIEDHWELYSTRCADWSRWHQRYYSRQREIEEICEIMERLHGRRKEG